MIEKDNKCGSCAKYPFCEYTNSAKQQACCRFIKRKLGKSIKKEDKKK